MNKYLLFPLIAMYVFAGPAVADLQSEYDALVALYKGKVSASVLAKADKQVSAAVSAIAERKTYTPQEIAALEKAAMAADAKEQSTANAMLGGVTMAATGIGGMQLMQGLAEKQADDDGAADMAAYLSTMTCGIGGNKNMKYNDVGTVPADTREMVDARMQYLAIAAKMKSVKESLGLPAGIESDLAAPLDGLYDNGGTTAGGIRHNFDTATQRADSGEGKKRAIAGGIALGAGALGGMIGNAAINDKDALKDAIVAIDVTAGILGVDTGFAGGAANANATAAAAATAKPGAASAAAKSKAVMSEKTRDDLIERMGSNGYAVDAVALLEKDSVFQTMQDDERLDAWKNALSKKDGKTVSAMTPDNLAKAISTYAGDPGYVREAGKTTNGDTRKSIIEVLDKTSTSKYAESAVAMMEHNAKFNALADEDKLAFVKGLKKDAKAADAISQKELTLAIIDFEKSKTIAPKK